MKCPACSVDLLMAERLGVVVDYCPQCRGIWLEKGKLDKLLETSELQHVEVGPERERENYREDRRDGKRRRHKRSMFDLFD
jgi:uncharacterized protein